MMPTNESFDAEIVRDPDRPPPSTRASECTDYFVFRLYDRTYALPPTAVELVVPVQPIVAVPTTGAHVRGVVYLRGRVIAVLDLASLLDIDEDHNIDEAARLVVVSAPTAAETPFAFVVDATLGIWAFANDAQTRTTDDGPIIRGRIEDRGGAATLIDPGAIVDRVMAMRRERP